LQAVTRHRPSPEFPNVERRRRTADRRLAALYGQRVRIISARSWGGYGSACCRAAASNLIGLSVWPARELGHGAPADSGGRSSRSPTCSNYASRPTAWPVVLSKPTTSACTGAHQGQRKRR
jgi:hypothetical protein